MPNSAVEFEKNGALIKVLVSSRDTKGDYTVCEVQTSGPIQVPAHQHTYEDQWCHVLAGSYEFHVDGKVIPAGPGASVEIPRQATSHVTSAQPGKLLIVARPGGLDMFFSDASCCDPAALQQVFEKHGIVLA
jgi:quercetin dioxygenase-like cupin family protein